MYLGLPSTPLLRQLRCIMLYGDFNILRLNNFSVWFGHSSQLQVVIPVGVYRDIIFPLYLLSRLYFMDG